LALSKVKRLKSTSLAPKAPSYWPGGMSGGENRRGASMITEDMQEGTGKKIEKKKKKKNKHVKA